MNTAKTSNNAPGPPVYPGNIRGRLLKGFGANLINQVLVFSTRVVLAPLFLKAWGVEVYGEWLLLSSFVAYLSLTDMGGQSYIANRLTQTYTQGNMVLFRKVLHTGLALFLIMPTAVFLLFSATIRIVPTFSFLQISHTNHQVVVWVLTILAFQFIFGLPQGIVLGIYRAIGRLPRGVMLSNLTQLLQLAFIAGGLWLGGGMILIAALQALPFLLVAILAVIDLNSRFPQFSLLSLNDAEVSIGRTFVKPSLHFLSIQASLVFSIQGTVLVVGMVLAPVQVVIFTTIRTMTQAMRQLVYLLIHSAWPEITRLDAEQNVGELLSLFRAILRSALVATAILILIFHFFGGAIYRLWLGDTVEYQQVAMDLFLIYALQLVFWTTCSSLLMATNIHHALAKILLVSSLVGIVLAYLGGRYFGLRGVIVGMTIGDALMPLWLVPYLVNRYDARFSLKFFLKEASPIIGSLICVALLPWSGLVVPFLLLLWWARCLPKLLSAERDL